jgi:maleylacetate reductase
VTGLRFDHEALPGRIVFGAGRVAELPAELERLGARRALFVVGGSQAGVAERFAPQAAGVVEGVRQHVPVEDAEAARRAAAEAGADGLVALGGGSAIGLAKAVALTTGLPIVAVPTTYSGSEMTAIWGLTEGGRKTTGRDRSVLPRTVVYDAELTLDLPVRVAGPSGMNAIAHAVEALWLESATPLTAVAAEEAIRLLAQALPRIAEAPADLVARERALAGAWLAGSAIGVAGTGLHHRICHVLGGLGLPHGETHAVLLPYSTAFHATAAPTAVERAARALEADDAVAALLALDRALGIPLSLAELGLEPGQLEVAAGILGREDVRRLLDEAFAGELG